MGTARRRKPMRSRPSSGRRPRCQMERACQPSLETRFAQSRSSGGRMWRGARRRRRRWRELKGNGLARSERARDSSRVRTRGRTTTSKSKRA